MTTKPATIALGISGRTGCTNGTTAYTARPAHITQTSPTHTKRGHIRSASLENGKSFTGKNTTGLPILGGQQQQHQQPNMIHTGTLKSRNEQKRMRSQKFGSHSSLDQEALPVGRTKFQNIRQIFEITKKRAFGVGGGNGSGNGKCEGSEVIDDGIDEQRLHSLPPQSTFTNAADVMMSSMPNLQVRQQTQQQQLHIAYQQQYAATHQQQSAQLTHKPTPTLLGGGSGNRSSYSEVSERLSISEGVGAGDGGSNVVDENQKMRLQQQQQHLVQQQQQLQQQAQSQRQHNQLQTRHQSQQHPHQQIQLQQRNSNGLPPLSHIVSAPGQATITTSSTTTTTMHGYNGGAAGVATEQRKPTTTSTPTMSVMTSYENLLRPIAFKPIPFEPDYSIPNRYVGGDIVGAVVGDRYGSTPSLAPTQGANHMRFGSTTDLRHGGNGGVMGVVSGVGGVGGGGAAVAGGIAIGGNSSSNYCNSLMARRRGSRSLKINDSMESIRHTPDSDVHSQTSTIKSNYSNSNANGVSNNGIGIGIGAGNSGSSGTTNSNGCGGSKYLLSDQSDMTPSPSDSGVSDLEAALKDRDSELSYLRQTMEHNEKDKENFWENETKRLKVFYEGQQREYVLKLKKMEQMLAMQQFQFKQHKLKHADQSNKLREQMADLKNENEILRSTNSSLKNSERNLKDSVAYIEEQLRESEQTIAGIRAQLEESEWKVCERNGELALLKSQLKEANVEITIKEHAIVHLRHENNNAETQIYESLQENQKISQQQKQVEEQKAHTEQQSESELKQLNKIVILKDQVILALTNELAKLRKELSDLAIFHEYGEEPSGRFIRLKQQLDNLSDICNRTRRRAHKCDTVAAGPKEKVLDDTNLELIMNCLKMAPSFDAADTADGNEPSKLCAEKRLAKMSADIQKFVYGSQNLPDIAMNHSHDKPMKHPHSNPHKLEESTLDTLIEETANYAEEIAKLRKQLDDVRVDFELEKRQWCEEREKVLNYQKQLQVHYINMYQKLRSLESSNDV